MSKHKLHRHPLKELLEGLTHEVIVDVEFKNLFSEHRKYDELHVIVPMSEYCLMVEENAYPR